MAPSFGAGRGGIFGQTSPPRQEVGVTYRLLGTLRYLGLISSDTLRAATAKNKVAKMVINEIVNKSASMLVSAVLLAPP